MCYPPDPYQGWYNLNSCSNWPASRIMTDTSSSVRMVGDYGTVRTYTTGNQGLSG
jgi:hypothetical protein